MTGTRDGGAIKLESLPVKTDRKICHTSGIRRPEQRSQRDRFGTRILYVPFELTVDPAGAEYQIAGIHNRKIQVES